MIHGQLGLLTTQRLAGDLQQLMDYDCGQETGRQRVEDADRPHGNFGIEHLRHHAPQRTGMSPPQIDHTYVLERRDERNSDQEKREEQSLSVGGDAAIEIKTVMIAPVYTAAAQSTVPTVYRPHRLHATITQHVAIFSYCRLQ